MNAPTELAVVEQPQQLITIEPTKYVELVFEPFARRLADAKTLAEAAQFDVTTTAGMAVAVKYRATFREIRVASEKARKERKAPILEIGKLLDTRQKEIEAEIEPFESRFDVAIKAEEKRKDDEKIAKAVAESARISAIRKNIAELQAMPAEAVGWSSAGLTTGIETLQGIEITLEEFAEFSDEAEMIKTAAVDKLGEMLKKQQDHEAEAARLAAEREQLERERAEAAERERIAAAARAEQERKDREALEQEEALVNSIWKEARRIEANTVPYIRKAIGTFESMAGDWENDPRQRVSSAIASAREEMQAKLRRAEEADEREAEQRKLDDARAEIARQQAAIDSERQRQADEAARGERERMAAIQAEADRVAAEEQRRRDAAEVEAQAEAERVAAERQAEEAERIRLEQEAKAADTTMRNAAQVLYDACAAALWEDSGMACAGQLRSALLLANPKFQEEGVTA